MKETNIGTIAENLRKSVDSCRRIKVHKSTRISAGKKAKIKKQISLHFFQMTFLKDFEIFKKYFYFDYNSLENKLFLLFS